MNACCAALRSFPFWLLLSLGCGGAAPPTPAAPVEQVAKRPEAPPPDLSPVEDPASLIFVGRISKPSEVLRIVGGWTHLPMPGSKVATEALTGEASGELLDIEQPIDVAVAGDMAHHDFSPVWAAAAAVKSIDAARSALSARYKLVPGDNGSLVIEGLGGEGDDDKPSRVCELAPSAGAAPFRLVCGSSGSALRALGPFLTRAAPRMAIGSDVHTEVRFEPLKPLMAMGRAMMPAMLDRVLDVNKSNNAAASDLIEAATGEVADLVTDADRMVIDAKLEDAFVRFDTQATFKTASSVSARIATGHADRVDVPPSGFWRLPADADVAFFNRGLDTKELEHPRDLLLSVLDHALEQESLPEADRKAVLEALSHLVTSPAPMVFAKGFDAAAVEQAAGAFSTAKDDSARDQIERRVAEQVLGWWLVGLDESSARVQSSVRALVAAWNRPAVEKWMKSKGSGRRAPALRLAPVEVAWKLPKDAMHVELTVFPEPPKAGAGHDAKISGQPAEPPVKFHALIVPDGGRVWMAAGMNVALAASKVSSVLSTAPAVQTLATRPGLEPMKDARVSSGGFMTMRGLLAGPLVVGLRRHPSDPLHALNRLPDHGMTPMTFSGAAMPGSDAAPAGSVVGTFVVPKAVIEGMVTLAMEVSSSRGQGHVP